MNETNEQFSSRLDRDAEYRIAALYNAVNRAGQDGGIQGEPVDVLVLAEVYYGWIKGGHEVEKPTLERLKREAGKN